MPLGTYFIGYLPDLSGAGAQPYFSKISFNYSWLEVCKNMEVVLKAVLEL